MDDKNQKHDVPISGHAYDGIEEFDNRLPRWWVYMFYLSIAFAFLYFCYYSLGPGPSPRQVFVEDRAAIDDARAAAAAAAGGDEATLKAAVKDSHEVAEGAKIFAQRCTTCHGDHAQGNIGPNLTDDYWIHGGRLTDIDRTITQGVPDKGMPTWGQTMKPEEIVEVVAYVRSLRGTHPAGAKAPQGELYKGDD